ncbi:MAG: electron transport complex subunit E [Clostridia bacterium]|nr:electron transport complex subunit E [Clostridia bacterium]
MSDKKSGYSLKTFAEQMRRGLFTENPTFVQLLGMCPTLATTTSVKNAFGMGITATAVLILSNVLISLLRKLIPSQVRIPTFIVIISAFVSAAEMVIKAFFFDLYGSLGLFIPLIVVNCIILGRAEAFASKNRVLPSAVDGLSMGLGFTFALVCIGFIRELLGAGTVFGYSFSNGWYDPAIIFLLPAGAFFTLGMIIAAVQKVRNVISDRDRYDRLSNVSMASDIPANFLSSKMPISPDSSTDPDSANRELDFYPPEAPRTGSETAYTPDKNGKEDGE